MPDDATYRLSGSGRGHDMATWRRGRQGTVTRRRDTAAGSTASQRFGLTEPTPDYVRREAILPLGETAHPVIDHRVLHLAAVVPVFRKSW